MNDSNRKSMSTSNIKSESSAKVKPKSRLDWREKEKENESPKSHGIAATNFHRKRQQEKSSLQMEEFKEIVEKNILILDKEKHSSELESKRKAFRQITCLKTWPLQHMAMDHLDHLLGKNCSSQFHGGDYLSSESSSSVESMEAKRRASPSKKVEQQQLRKGYMKKFQNSQEPLWSQVPRIFATEKAQGKRKYLVGHFGRIADWYWRKSNEKHLYEVIRENTPCRLYFDLEYSKKHNPSVDQKQLLTEFREELKADLMEHFQVNLETNQIIDLDSSTDVKFSRHWIFDSEGCLFEDAPTVGRFVKRLVSRLADDLATGQLEGRRPELAKHLFVNTKEAGKTSCFIDLGVYTRNRLFRVFGSSKFGKKATLEVSDTNQYPIQLPPKQPPSQNSGIEDYVVANDWEPHARVLAQTLVVPLDGVNSDNDIRILKVDEEDVGIPGPKTNSGTSKKYQPCIPMRNSATPLPSLDRYVSQFLANRGGIQGSTRAWSIEYGPKDMPASITYQLSRNRYCELIGRSHKSNNVFWTIDLSLWTCVQGCHDPECFGRGSPIPIPDEEKVRIQDEYNLWQEEEFEQALLALNLDESKSSNEPNHVLKVGTQINDEGNRNSNDCSSSNLATPQDQSESETLSPKADGDDGDKDDVNSSTFLSDGDILNAVLSNPELFP